MQPPPRYTRTAGRSPPSVRPELHGAGGNAFHTAVAVEANIVGCERALNGGAGTAVVALKDGFGATVEVKGNAAPGKAVRHGQHQLNAAGAATHHRHAGTAINLGLQRTPTLPQACHRFHRYRMFARAGYRIHIGLGSNVQAQQVVVDGRPPGECEAPGLRIQRGDLSADKSHTRPGAQSLQVDMGLFEAIVSRDQARQHA